MEGGWGREESGSREGAGRELGGSWEQGGSMEVGMELVNRYPAKNQPGLDVYYGRGGGRSKVGAGTIFVW